MRKETERAKDQLESARPISTEPESLSRAEEQIFMASQWQLMLRRFKKHRLAMASLIIIAIVYLAVLFCEVLAPYDPKVRYPEHKFVPPQKLRFFDTEGRFHIRPFVYGLIQHINPDTLRYSYTHDLDSIYPICFFVRGDRYKFWGLIETDMHLFGAGRSGEGRVFLLGTDSMGRDMLSRVIFGARISLTIGLVGVAISFVMGMLIGGISGYYGGTVDLIIQRVIEVFRSIPHIPFWMALSAAIPPHWPQLRVYFAITVILSFVGWIDLARVVRGKFLSLREEDFVMAAKTSGSSRMRIIWRHLVPSFMSHIIASLTLAIPAMILGETALSFLGIGLKTPLISWGVLLQEAQNARTIALHPWLLLPGVFVIIIILAFNFAGDGLRDAADPYGI